MEDFIQFKIVSQDFKKTYMHLKSAKIDFGLFCKDIKKEDWGWVEMYGRKDYEGSWVRLQEYYLNVEDEDDNEDDEQEDTDE